MLKTAVIATCHVLWFLTCLPGWLLFQAALWNPRLAQERALRRLIRRNRNSGYGRRHDFHAIRGAGDFAARVPLAEYEDFATAINAARAGVDFDLSASRPLLLEPTSGSSGAPKLIPVTAALRREFAAAVQPWIAWLYLAHPGLLLGRQYWAISPNTTSPLAGADSAHAVPVGFADDADYLGVAGRLLSRGVLAAPPELRHVADPESFLQWTLLFLLREKNLRLVSVWHPSFLTLLLDSIPRHLAAITDALRTGILPAGAAIPPGLRTRLARRFRADPRRAAELSELDPATHPERIGRIWPRLAVISCWEGPRAEPWLGALREHFPQAVIQGKGLLATEGCVTLPTGCGKFHPCAIRSHYLEFIAIPDGRVHPLWELERGGTYSVVLTTGGGLWRYRLHDEVRVTGFLRATPCLEFVGKDNAVSDLVGEKLHERHVAGALKAVETATGVRPIFAMVVPEKACGSRAGGYRLLLELPSGRAEPGAARDWADAVERELCRNFHYAHARRLGQLEALQVIPIRNGLAEYRCACESRGTRLATLKPPALDVGCAKTPGWWRGGAEAILPALCNRGSQSIGVSTGPTAL